MSDNKRGKFLQQLRVEKKLTQKEVGDILHYSDKAVSNWEKGKTLPNNPETLMKLSELYGISLEELLYGERKNSTNSQKISNNMEIVYQNNYKSFKKVLNLVFFLSLIIIIISMLFIYFVFIKGKILSYTIQGDSEHFVIAKSTMLFTGKINVLNFNKVMAKNEEKINYIELYYLDDKKEKKMIFKGPNDDYYIEEMQGYGEYDLEELKDNDIFVDIRYDSSADETIKLVKEQNFINNNIFGRKAKKISDDTIHNDDSATDEFIQFLIKEGFTEEGQEYEKQTSKLRFVYSPGMNEIYLYNRLDKVHEKIELYLDKDKDAFFYELFDETKNSYFTELYSLNDLNIEKINIQFITDNIEYLLYLKNNFK